MATASSQHRFHCFEQFRDVREHRSLPGPARARGMQLIAFAPYLRGFDRSSSASACDRYDELSPISAHLLAGLQPHAALNASTAQRRCCWPSATSVPRNRISHRLDGISSSRRLRSRASSRSIATSIAAWRGLPLLGLRRTRYLAIERHVRRASSNAKGRSSLQCAAGRRY